MHVEGFGDRWCFAPFLHLRVLDITHWDNTTSTKDLQWEFHSILASLTSPVLEHVRLELHFSAATPLTQDMDSRDATTVADGAQDTDLHAVLARPIFSSLHRVTVVLCLRGRKRLVSTKDVPLKHLDFLRALFAPWYVRGIANLACAICSSGLSFSWEVAVDKGEGPRYIDLRGRGYYLDTVLQVVGCDR